jgi:hypothetical protein
MTTPEKVKRLPVIVHGNHAQVCQACLVKWAREIMGEKLYCVACVKKAIQKLAEGK